MQLTKSYMNYIEVDVRSDSGEPFPFSKHVKMLLTLHFKRDKNEVVPLLPPLTYYDDKKVYIQ